MCVEHHIHTKGVTVQDPDRWVSHTPCGQEFWQILSQWIWNLRLEFGQQVSATSMRLTEFASSQIDEPVQASEPVQVSEPVQADESVSYGPPQWRAAPSP